MTMFNSQKINNDPEPYVVDFGLALGEVRGAEDCGSHWDSHDTRYEPRPEYDNNPNPILVKLRENSLGWETIEEIAKGNLGHIDHAKRVLEKLVNVYG